MSCLPGYSNADANPALECAECPMGRYNNGTETVGACDACGIGKFGNSTAAGSDAACFDCEPGTWSTVDGAPECQACPASMFRGGADANGCVPCSDVRYRCSSQGMVHPLAAPGYFLSKTKVAALEESGEPFTKDRMDVCIPFAACTGTCPAEVFDMESPDYELCLGGMNYQSCSIGYTSDRCSACVPLDETRQPRCTEHEARRSLPTCISPF